MVGQCAAQLRILQRQYFQLVEPHQLRWPDGDTLKRPDVQSWLFANLFNTELVKTPPPDRYQLRILKILIAKLEKSITDPEEDVCHLFLRIHSGLALGISSHRISSHESRPPVVTNSPWCVC